MMTVRQALDMSIREIKVKIEQHEQLLDQMEGGSGVSLVPDCGLAGCSHSRRLKKILLEAVEALENSRRAFKSKELEVLRKKMIRMLADNA
jgi:hypothetical protein